MFQQTLAVFLVLALLGATLWLLRSRGLARYRGPARHKSAKHLEAIARLSLTQHHSLHMISVSDHAIVLALSPTGCTLIERVPWTTATVMATVATHSGASQ
jgi:flagellar biogenesis protein FliO